MKCASPMSIPRPKGLGSTDRITVPCGQCIACLLNKQQYWVIRLTEQQKSSETSHFITLTYDDENLPIDDFGGGHTHKNDVQLFLKRLRKYCKKTGIKYFITAEYGDTTNRPHYHGIFFNLPFHNGNLYYKRKAEKILTNVWKNGVVDVEPCTPKTISYVTKYVVNNNKYPEDKLPTFNLISKGIGKSYLTAEIKKYHLKTKNFHYTTLDGGKRSLPRYYKEKIFSKMEIQLNSKKIQKLSDDEWFKKPEDEQSGKYAREIYEAMVNRIKSNKKLRTKL
ncbi:MAG: replication initiator protein [Microviridae sp.]|nr:MAG: replication initiator protein [Microviridae sp.]